MNDLTSTMGALGLELPSPAYIVGSILFGLIGVAVFRHGRRLQRREMTWAGITLMVYPYIITETWMMWAFGAALCAWIYSRWE